MVTIYFKKVYEDAILPSYGNNDINNAGIDLCAYLLEPAYIVPQSFLAISTGISWYVEDINKKYCMIIKSRSGLAFKHQIESSNAGVIDHHYTGEIKVLLYNNGTRPYEVKHGDRIAQGIVYELPFCAISEWPFGKPLPSTSRGSNGFGSTGLGG